MNTELRNRIANAKTEIAQDPNHELSFRTRKEILRELGPVLDRGIIGVGLLRRTNICIWVVKRVLSIWEAHYSSDHPHRMIAFAEQYLSGKCTRSEVIEESEGFRGGLDNSDLPERQSAYLVGRGSVCAAFVAIDDELLKPTNYTTEEELYDPDDPDVWDCAYWIAGAESGGMPWESSFDRFRYRAFWEWYLDTAVPDASLIEL